MSAHWFTDLADHMGEAYLRYSFTKGTVQEVDALVDLLDLEPGEAVLDVGCGPGRHALELASRGFDVVGIDISETFVELANETARRAGLGDRARFEVADARSAGVAGGLDLSDRFDAVISLCQGAFGLAGGRDALDELPARELDEPILRRDRRRPASGGPGCGLGVLGLLPGSVPRGSRHLRCVPWGQPRDHRGP